MTIDATQTFKSTPAAAIAETDERRRWLFNPIVDFLGLGGITLIVLPLLVLLVPTSAEPKVAFIMLLAANVLNHPHFAHSYQIFYRGFNDKAFGQAYPLWLRRRYLFAGVFVPAGLATYFALGFAMGSPTWMTLTFNLMGFLVGWHYVKQGYGMLMVDCALKKSFFNDHEKKFLRVNGYVVWAFTWVLINNAAKTSDYLGLKTYAIAFPDWMVWGLGAIVAATAAYGAFLLFTSYTKRARTIPVNGLTAYLVTLYLWMVFSRINPLFILVIPALHSLQYLLVVYRFQLNVEKGQDDAREAPETKLSRILSPNRFALRFTAFVLIGLTAGFVSFFGLPSALDDFITYDSLLGSTAFIFTFWIFINIHHYCLDNVMWRRENPETSKYLFAAK